MLSGNTLARGLTLDDAGLLWVDGRPLALPPKERAVLRLLLQRAPGVARKQEFAAQAWRGADMSDESLARSISQVRRIVAARGLKIEAVYGVGYRLFDPHAPVPPSGTRARTRDDYNHARQLLQQRTPAAMQLAIGLLRGIVRDDPRDAAARIALAEALAIAVGWGELPTPPAVDEGLAALATLDDMPGLHAARGALLDMAWRFDEARRAFDLALAGNHADGADNAEALLGFARHLLYTDEAGAAVDLLRRVRQVVPHALHVRMALARALVQSGRGAEAVQEAQAAVADHPGQLVTAAFALAMQAMVAPHPDLEAAAWRLTQGPETPPFVWTVASFVLSRLGRREETLHIVDAVLLCSHTTADEASLYAAPLATLGEYDRAAALLRAAVDERCDMMAMMLRDPTHSHWLPRHGVGRSLMRTVFGAEA